VEYIEFESQKSLSHLAISIRVYVTVKLHVPQRPNSVTAWHTVTRRQCWGRSCSSREFVQ